MADLRINSLSVVDSGLLLVDDVSFAVAPGEMVALIGPNGAGKTSLLRGMMGRLVPTHGGASVGGQLLHNFSPAARARTISWLPQSVPLAWPIRVIDAVALGRFAHGDTPATTSADDHKAIAAAIRFCSLEPLVNRSTAKLSGGELARVHLARALATGAPWLLADEPVAALDPAQRVAIMQKLRDHARLSNVGMVIVLHDIDLAARLCDRLIAMRGGKLIAQGTPAEIIQPDVIRALFDADALVDHATGWPRITVMTHPATS